MAVSGMSRITVAVPAEPYECSQDGYRESTAYREFWKGGDVMVGS